MDDLLIRPANVDDFDRLCQLYHAFHDEQARHAPAYLHELEPFEERDCKGFYAALEQIVGSDASAILVAVDRERIIGVAEVYLHRTAPHAEGVVARRWGYLQSLMVIAEKRRQGIGRRLVQAAHGWVQARGAHEMELIIWESADGAALAFYTRLGYRTIKRTLAMAL